MRASRGKRSGGGDTRVWMELPHLSAYDNVIAWSRKHCWRLQCMLDSLLSQRVLERLLQSLGKREISCFRSAVTLACMAVRMRA